MSFPDLACGLDLYASKNPAAVGDNVMLSLSSPLDIVVGSWTHDGQVLVLIYPGGYIPYDSRVTFNRTSSSLSIRSLQLSDSGDYILQNGANIVASLTLSVQGKRFKIATTLIEYFNKSNSRQVSKKKAFLPLCNLPVLNLIYNT